MRHIKSAMVRLSLGIVAIGFVMAGGVRRSREDTQMQKMKSFTFVILFGIAALGLSPSPSKAVVMYTYTGTLYGLIPGAIQEDNNPPPGSYEPTMRLSGYFTVTDPLPPSTDDIDVIPLALSYSFNDGRQTIDDGTAAGLPMILISTNEFGLPWNWRISLTLDNHIALGDSEGHRSSRIINFTDFPLTVANQVSITWQIPRGPNLGVAIQSDRVFLPPRPTFVVWDRITGLPSGGTVSEPSTLLLFGAGLAALAGFGRRRRQV